MRSHCPCRSPAWSSEDVGAIPPARSEADFARGTARGRTPSIPSQCRSEPTSGRSCPSPLVRCAIPDLLRSDRAQDRPSHRTSGVDRRTIRNPTVLSDRLLRMCSFRSEEHTSELQSLMRISYAVFCLQKKKTSYNKL